MTKILLEVGWTPDDTGYNAAQHSPVGTGAVCKRCRSWYVHLMNLLPTEGMPTPDVLVPPRIERVQEYVANRAIRVLLHSQGNRLIRWSALCSDSNVMLEVMITTGCVQSILGGTSTVYDRKLCWAGCHMTHCDARMNLRKSGHNGPASSQHGVSPLSSLLSRFWHCCAEWDCVVLHSARDQTPPKFTPQLRQSRYLWCSFKPVIDGNPSPRIDICSIWASWRICAIF